MRKWACGGLKWEETCMLVHMVQYMSVDVCASWRASRERACALALRCHWAICFSNVYACVPCTCVSASCARIVHAWVTSVPEVPQGPGKEAGGMLWRRGSHPLVCAVTSVERFLQQGAKGEDSRGERALFSVCVWCVCVLEMASFGVSTMSTSSEASCFSHVCFSIQQLVLKTLIKQRLICVL